MDQKERYVVEMADGTKMNVLETSFQRVLLMFGEENIVRIEKKDYEGEQ